MALVLGIIFETLSVIGLLLTSVFLLSLIRWGYLKKDVPFTIIFNLALSYFCHLCIITFHSAPEVILGHDPFSEELEHAAKYAYACFWCVTLFCQNLVSINRYIAVCKYDSYEDWLNLFRVRILCVSSWVVGLLIAAVPETGVCCRVVFDTHVVNSFSGNMTLNSGEQLHQKDDSHEDSHEEMQYEDATELTGYRRRTNWFLVGVHGLNFLTIVFMICFYVRIWMKVKENSEQQKIYAKTSQVVPEIPLNDIRGIPQVDPPANSRSNKISAAAAARVEHRESQIRRMSFQMFVLSLLFGVFCVFQVLVQFVFTNVVMMLILQFAYLINCCIVPLVFLVLNKKIRKEMLITLLKPFLFRCHQNVE